MAITKLLAENLKQVQKELQPSNRISLLDDIYSPEYILYSQDGKTVKLPQKSFLKMSCASLIGPIAETVYVKESDLQKWQQDSLDLLREGGVSRKMASQTLSKLIHESHQKLCLFDVGDGVGYSCKAAAKIKKGTLFLYAGEAYLAGLHANVNIPASVYLYAFAKRADHSVGVDAKFSGGLARWIMHLTGTAAEKGIKCNNLASYPIYLTDKKMVIPCLIAESDIEKDEVLGYNYNEQAFFKELRIPVRYVNNTGKLMEVDELELTLELQNMLDKTFKSIKMTIPWSMIKSYLEDPNPQNRYCMIRGKTKDYNLCMVLAETGMKKLMKYYRKTKYVAIEADQYLDTKIIDSLAQKILNFMLKHCQHPFFQQCLRYIKQNKTWVIDCSQPGILIFDSGIPMKLHTYFEDLLQKIDFSEVITIIPQEEYFAFGIGTAQARYLAEKFRILPGKKPFLSFTKAEQGTILQNLIETINAQPGYLDTLDLNKPATVRPLLQVADAEFDARGGTQQGNQLKKALGL